MNAAYYCSMCGNGMSPEECDREFCLTCMDHSIPQLEGYMDGDVDDGQPDHYTEMQDYYGGDDWDYGQYDCGEW